MQNKSEENWQVGQRCLNDGKLNAATSRLYYGLLQAILLYAKNKKGYISRGSGVHKDMVDIVYRKGMQSKRYGRIMSKFRALRETADYEKETPDLSKINEILPDCGYMRIYYLKEAGV